uniref:Uncharacterized protein n=1 Tax=viral metagenome TaxID=1070528 RepID=A0A6M3JVU2_9ZZZZ
MRGLSVNNKQSKCGDKNMSKSNSPSVGVNAVVMLRPNEWAKEENIKILDPDGWRNDNKDFNEPITYDEYLQRMVRSTICPLSTK